MIRWFRRTASDSDSRVVCQDCQMAAIVRQVLVAQTPRGADDAPSFGVSSSVQLSIARFWPDARNNLVSSAACRHADNCSPPDTLSTRSLNSITRGNCCRTFARRRDRSVQAEREVLQAMQSARSAIASPLGTRRGAVPPRWCRYGFACNIRPHRQ
jgi:hypothetical protein